MQTTHWQHPRLLLEERRQEYVRKEEEVRERAETKRQTLQLYRKKRRMLEEMKLAVLDDEEKVALSNTLLVWRLLGCIGICHVFYPLTCRALACYLVVGGCCGTSGGHG